MLFFSLKVMVWWPCDFPPKTRRVACGVIPVNWVIIYWYVCGADGPTRRAYGQVITRISRLDRLPNFLRYGVPLARALHALWAPLWINVKFSIFSRVSKVKWDSSCPVPVRRLFRPSRSMHFGDVSETNGRETFSDHVTRNASAAHNNEA